MIITLSRLKIPVTLLYSFRINTKLKTLSLDPSPRTQVTPRAIQVTAFTFDYKFSKLNGTCDVKQTQANEIIGLHQRRAVLFLSSFSIKLSTEIEAG